MPVLLTFDDGGASFYDPIAPMLEEFGWRGHFFISTDYIGRPEFMTPQQLRELAQRGHVIGSHSCSHPTRMAHCSHEQLEREWSESINMLTDILGQAVTAASVPGGYYSRAVGETAADAGIRFLFNSEPVTRIRPLAECTVFGRYAVQRSTTPSECAALASGRFWPAFRQRLLWDGKKVIKAAGGRGYLKISQFLLSRR
jgi:peptidoglycan/xylan/chitin deacetylase (PgdA/CDA1 family)